MEKRDIPQQETLMNTCHKLISVAWNIGNRIHQNSIDKWLSNFSGEALRSVEIHSKEPVEKFEKRLALFLLCNFVYYNEDEIKYLTRTMFDKYVHSVFLSENKTIVNDTDINDLLKKTQFTFLGRNSESSSYLLYHFRQENDLSTESFEENEETTNVVFIDDFSITGEQVYRHIASESSKNKKRFVLLMVATKEAVAQLEKLGITVLPCIVLDDKSKVFSDTSAIFEGYKDHYKELTKTMCEFYGKKLIGRSEKMTPLGYAGGEYMFGTHYNIPNNTLPIFWSNKNGWHYLFKRYDKKNGWNINSGGRYVYV